MGYSIDAITEDCYESNEYSLIDLICDDSAEQAYSDISN